MSETIQWKDLDDAARKWVRGYVAVMCKDMQQKIAHHTEFDETMLFYFRLPQFLTREQFEKTDAGKEIKVDWDNDRFIIDKKD
jgi:hypothetical protein